MSQMITESEDARGVGGILNVALNLTLTVGCPRWR